MTPEEKKIRNREATTRWRNKNKEREALRQREYIEANRERINERNRQYRINNPEKARLYNKKANAKRPIEYFLLEGCRYRAKKYGLDFNLTLDDIVIPEICPVLSLKLMKLKPNDEGYNRDYSPSVDRIDNSKGYTKDNIQIISFRANRIKSDASPDELKLIYEYSKLVKSFGISL